MAIPTVNVAVHIEDASGVAVSGAKVNAKLNRSEVDAGIGYVIPDFITVTTDVNGDATLVLWPNVLGATESLYEITITDPSSRSITSFTAVIPNNACNLWDVANLPVYPGKSDTSVGIMDNATVNQITITDTEVTFNNAVDILGAFTSLGIDDNATSTQLTLSDTAAVFGTSITLGGTALSNWAVGWNVNQLGNKVSIASTANTAWYIRNAYYDGAWKYQTTDEAQHLEMTAGGGFNFYTAPSGTVDTAITWTTALTINNSGNASFLKGLDITTNNSHLKLLSTLAADTADYFLIDKNAEQFRLLSYDNSLTTFKTVLTAQLSGSVAFGDNVSLIDNSFLYLGTGNDLSLTHQTTYSAIDNKTGAFSIRELVNSGSLNLQSYDSVGALKTGIVVGGATPVTKLYGNGILALETTASGNISILNNLFAQSNISVTDNSYLYVGTGNDLAIQHNGSYTSIFNKTGTFFIKNSVNSGLLSFYTYDSVGVDKLGINVGGAVPYVRLYYDGILAAQTHAARGLAFGEDNSFAIYRDTGSNPFIVFDVNDYLYYHRTNNEYIFRIASSTKMVIRSNTLNVNMPTSSAGLVAGDLWNNAGVVNIV